MSTLLIAPQEAAASFISRFEAAWNSHDTAALGALLHPEVVLVQPIHGTLRGRRPALQMLSDFLILMPDLKLTVHRSLVSDDSAFIEFSIVGTIGRRRVELRMIDSIGLEAGHIRSRVCCFDSSAIWIAVAKQPRLWLIVAPRLLRGKEA